MAYKNNNNHDFILNEHLNFESNRLFDTALRLHRDNHSVAIRAWLGLHLGVHLSPNVHN